MRYLTLNEYRTTTEIELSADERDQLRAFLDVTPSRGKESHYDLTPGASAGAINLGTLAVTIQPKLPIDRLLFLVSYAMAHERWRNIPFDLEQRDDLVEAIVPGFVAQVRRALQRGVLQGYRTEEDALHTVRGRIRFDEQLRRRQGRILPLELRFDEYTTDVEENRLLKAAIHRLRRLRLRSERSRHALEAFEDVLSEVRLVEYEVRRLPEVHWTRLNERYRSAVELAKLILRAVSFELGHGATPASAFLLDMNQVFENFVVVALRDALRLSERSFPQGNAGRWLALDARGRVRLKPDLSWWEGNRCVFVGDVKYKRVNVTGVLHPDLYQLLAYAIAGDLPGGLLIYAAGEREPAIHEIVNAGKRLDVVTLDLSGSPEHILAQIAGVAGRVRQLRAESRTQSAVYPWSVAIDAANERRDAVMRTITITLSDELEDELQRIADERGSNGTASIDAVVEDALREYVDHRARDTATIRPTSGVQYRLFTPLREKDEFGEPDAGINHDKYLAEAFHQRRRSRDRA